MKFIKNPILRFLINALLLYICWYLTYVLWLEKNTNIDHWVIKNTIDIGAKILAVFGYDIANSEKMLAIQNLGGVWIGNECNGVPLFTLFAGFIIALPGGILRKMIYIPLGIISIHFLNIFRIVALLLIHVYAPESLNFNHTYTFTILMYGYIFILWIFWVNKSKNYFNKAATNS